MHSFGWVLGNELNYQKCLLCRYLPLLVRSSIPAAAGWLGRLVGCGRGRGAGWLHSKGSSLGLYVGWALASLVRYQRWEDTDQRS